MDFPTSAKLNINNFDANGVNNQPLNHVPVIDKYIMLIITIKHALSQKKNILHAIFILIM